MSGLENPFNLTAATADQFVGRTDILQRWQERLTPDTDAWNIAQSWLIIGSGGVGKTSLLRKMAQVAQDNFRSHVIHIDLGYYRHLDRDYDFFHYLDTRLPPAKTWSTRLRRWFDLPADASTGEVTKKFFSLLSHFAVAFSHVNWGEMGFEFGIPDTSPDRPIGFGLRLLQAFNTLAILSEEQERPVVLLVDQLDKTHDAYRWLLIGYQFLQFAEHIHRIQASNIVCIFTLRPERKGLLEYELEHYLRTPLFRHNVYHIENLHPFQEQEAKIAIIERAKGKLGWGYDIAGKITQALNTSSGIDPYHVILGASAVWQHLYDKEESKHPRELDDLVVYDIVRQGHSLLLESIRHHNKTQWAVLSRLAFHPAGLTVEDITEQLNSRRYNLSLPEVEKALTALTDRSGYRLLDKLTNAHTERYTLIHDLLREYLTQQLPEEERKREETQKLLDDGTWRYANKYSLIPFSQQELETFWQQHAQLSFTSLTWQAILNSELHGSETKLLLWMTHYPAAIAAAYTQRETERTDSRSDFRYHLTAAYIDPNRQQLSFVLGELAHNSQDERVRLEAVKALGQLEEPALSVLSELANNSQYGQVRLEAVKALGQLGEPALSMLSELAQNRQNGRVRFEAIKALGQLGAPALSVLSKLVRNRQNRRVRFEAIKALGQLEASALSVLSDLKHNSQDERVRLEAVKALGQLGKPDLSVLSELAHNSQDERVRFEAVKALGQLGKPDLSVLSELAHNSQDERVRFEAIKALGQLGEPALPVLSDLVHNNKDEQVRFIATKALVQLGEPALPVLSELAHNSQDERVHFEAIKALGQLGEPALPVLSDLVHNNKDEQVRFIAIKALVQLGEPALPVLSNLAYHNKDERERLEVVKALGQLGKPDLSVLSELKHNSQDERVRLEAAIALGQLGKPDLSVLSELKHNSQDERVRLEAIMALGQLGKPDPSALSELAHNRQNAHVRLEAVKALGQLGTPALSALSELARNPPDERVCFEAIKALGQLGEPALSALSELVHNSQDERVRLEAVKALGQLGTPALSALLYVSQNNVDKITESASLRLITLLMAQFVD